MTEADYDHSSMDLHLSGEGYKMQGGAIKPCGGEYKDFYQNMDLAHELKPNDKGGFDLIKQQTYVFKLQQKFSCLAKNSNIYAQATAKSTIGRLDVVARLIVDGMHVYESMDPNYISSGDMFLEITPITFNIQVKEGISLSQIRFFLGKPSDSIIPPETISEIVLKNSNHKDGTLSIDLSNEVIKGEETAAFQAIESNEYLPVWENKHLDPSTYWKKLPSITTERRSRLTIQPDKFYILRSKERIALPKGVAVYCEAMNEIMGEMRIHYAGFAHPYFGMNRSDAKEGTPLIFEVRGHNVKVNLTDGEKLAKMNYYRMSEDCENDEKGSDVETNPYNNQELQLSKVFKVWNS